MSNQRKGIQALSDSSIEEWVEGLTRRGCGVPAPALHNCSEYADQCVVAHASTPVSISGVDCMTPAKEYSEAVCWFLSGSISVPFRGVIPAQRMRSERSLLVAVHQPYASRVLVVA